MQRAGKTFYFLGVNVNNHQLTTFDSESELHHRRFAWTILDPIEFVPSDRKDDDFNSSNTSEKISKQKSYWNDIGIVGFRTILDSQANFVR